MAAAAAAAAAAGAVSQRDDRARAGELRTEREEPEPPEPRRRRRRCCRCTKPRVLFGTMSASAGGSHQPSQSRAIPTRTVAISDAAQLPQDYCTTPGGTLFSTTPGGEPRPACPPSRLARGTACSTNSFLPVLCAADRAFGAAGLASGAVLWALGLGEGSREDGTGAEA